MADYLADGMEDFIGGQDASKSPDRIAKNAYAASVNTLVSGGVLRPRWGFSRRSLAFPAGGVSTGRRFVSYENIFKTGKFQLLAKYKIASVTHLIVVISGIIFLINPDTLIVQILELEDRLNSRAPRLNWSIAGQFFVIFDFPNYPVILDGYSIRRADPAKYEVPVSRIGTFNQSRLFIANAGNEYTGGDPIGSAAASDAPVTFEEILTATDYYGQVFRLPTNDNDDTITAMGHLDVTDTSTGIGPMIIGTNKAVYTVGTNQPRSQWEASQFTAITVSSAGIVGQRALTNVNADAIFMSYDGHIRALTMASNEKTTWAKMPISFEVGNWLKFADRSLLKYAAVEYFNNKVFITANPYRVAATDLTTGDSISDYAFGGLVVLEMDSITQFGAAGNPMWAGLWTGIRPMDLTVVNERCFVIAKDSGSINSLYEIDPALSYDTADSKIRQVRSYLYSRTHNWDNSFLDKELQSIDINLENMKGDILLNVEYKANHASEYSKWATMTYSAPWNTCSFPIDCINGYAPHNLKGINLGSVTDNGCHPVTYEQFSSCRKLQLKLTIEGMFWELHEYRINAIPKPVEPSISICENRPKVAICKSCQSEWDIQEFESCQT